MASPVRMLSCAAKTVRVASDAPSQPSSEFFSPRMRGDELAQLLLVAHRRADPVTELADLPAVDGERAEVVERRDLTLGQHRDALGGEVRRAALVERDVRDRGLVVDRHGVVAERAEVVGRPVPSARA